MFRINLAKEADYLVCSLLTYCFQFLGQVQIHLKCCHITHETIINEFWFLSYTNFNLYSYEIVDKLSDIIKPSGPSGVSLP